MIVYRVGNIIDHHQFIELLEASTLSECRPIADINRMQEIIKNTSLMVTAWEKDLLVGVARSVTDFAYIAYLSDLVVRKSHQKQGIGTLLIHKTKLAIHPDSRVVLLSAPQATTFYPGIGMTHYPQAYILQDEKALNIK